MQAPRLQTLRFENAEEYLRCVHPEYNFLFTIKEIAVSSWHYKPEDAARYQSQMVALACDFAKKLDFDRCIDIIVEDETCTPRAAIHAAG